MTRYIAFVALLFQMVWRTEVNMSHLYRRVSREILFLFHSLLIHLNSTLILDLLRLEIQVLGGRP